MSDPRHLAMRARWATRRRRAIAYGTWQPFVDPEPVRDHIRALRAFGLSLDSIAVMAGEGPTALSELMYPGSSEYLQRIRPERAQRYLAVRFDLDKIPASAKVDASGTRRRLQALGRIGWPGSALAARLGVTEQALASYRSQPSVAASTARRVRDLYDELWNTPGGAKKASGHAKRAGWPPPLAWDDDTIDDPAAEPYGEARPSWTQRPATETAAEVDDYLEHVDPYATTGHLAARLGYADVTGIQNALKRAGRGDLLQTLARNAHIATNVTGRSA